MLLSFLLNLQEKSVHQHQSQALHKDTNLGPFNLSIIKSFHMKKLYLPYIIFM